MSTRASWERLPLVLRWVIGVVAVVVGYALAYALVAAALPDLGDLGIRLVLLVVAVPLVVVGVLRARRQTGGKDQARLFRRAMRTGVVPGDADVERWRPLVRRQEQYLRGLRGFNRVVWTLLALLAVAGGVYGGIVHGPVWWTFLAFGALIALVGWLFDRVHGRMHAKAVRVADTLEGPGAPSTPPST